MDTKNLLLQDYREMADFNEICREVVRIQQHSTLLLSFSRGKDSIGCFLRCLETGIFTKYVLFHFYPVDGLSFIDDYLAYFKKKFPFVTILNILDPQANKMKNRLLFQSPLLTAASVEIYKEFGAYTEYKTDQVESFIKEDEKLSEETLSAVGVKASDSPMRRLALSKTGAIALKRQKWYPIHDLSNNDIKKLINRHGVKYPDDYDLFGLTLDGLDYRFLKPIKDKRPEDYKKIKAEYPLIDLVIARREHYFGTKLRKSKFNYLIPPT